MGSPAIFKADRTKLLSSKGLELKDGTHIDNDGVVNFIKPDVTKWQAGSYTAATRPSGTFTATPAGLTVAKTTSLGTGSMSLLFSKAANNQQGSACVYEFDLPSAPNKFQAAMLQIKCDYVVNSGTFAAGSTSTDSDLIFYIEEFNGSTWSVKEPSNFKLFSSATNIVSTDGGIFQTNSDTTKIRLIAYVASKTTSAFTLKADFSLSPQVSSTGAAVTDWQSYTPTITHNSGGATNYTVVGKWRQVGDTMEVMGTAIFNNTSAAFSEWYFSLPSGYSIDSSKLSTGTAGLGNNLGTGNVYDSGVDVYAPGNVLPRSSTVLELRTPGTKTGSNPIDVSTELITNTNPFTFNKNDTISWQFKAPIQGWSSNTRISDGFEGREVSFQASRNGVDQTGVNPNNSAVKILFNSTSATSDSNKSGMYDTANSRFIAKSSGRYKFTSLLTVKGTNVLATPYVLMLYKNGVESGRGPQFIPPASTQFSIPMNVEIDAIAGDIFEIYLFGVGNNSSSTLSIHGNALQSFFSGFKIATPQTIMGSPVVALHAAGVAGADTIGTGNSLIKFTTVETNTHGTAAYSAGTGVFTAPESGYYRAAWLVTTASVNLSTSQRLVTYVAVDGVQYRNGSRSLGNGVSTPHSSSGAVESIYLRAGQTLSIYAISNVATTAATGTADAYFTVTKAGP